MVTVVNTTKHCKVNSTINVPITDVILTPATCASLVNEVMKNILYHRSQIPYPYTWLKSIVRKKRTSLEEGVENKSKNFTLSRHYQVVSSAYDCVESVMMNLIKAFTFYGNRLKEVIFVIGVTPFSSKEIFTIKVSSVSSGHVESNHVAENSKKQPKILREIFLQNSWMNLVECSLSCSNTYVFLKMWEHGTQIGDNDSLFIPTKPLSLHPNARHTVIDLNYKEPEEYMCCDKLEVFKDVNDFSTPRKIENSVESNMKNDCNEIWLQSKTYIKGFKDCFINKVSASELW